MTAGWSGGYVSDVEYVPGFYRQQSPPHLELAALLGGVDGRLPRGSDEAHYLELGCGRGLNALLMAASNPAWRVTAIDYNPAHIAFATALAHQAELTNVRFVEADFASLAAGPNALPAADVVSMHGVWSWVSPSVRAAIVRLLAAVVAPGGIVHVSYNVLPAWQGAVGLQRVVFEAGLRTAGRSDVQAVAGFGIADELRRAEARYLLDPLATGLMERVPDASVGYLAHEYMNAHWSPCFHADVLGALAEAKLDWAASANLLESFPELMLTTPQREVLNRYGDPVMRELIKDCCLHRQLRHDVFVRGARRMSAADRDEVLRRLTLMLAVPASEFSFELELPAGKGELGPAFRPIVAALEAGPATVGALLDVVPGKSNPAELPAVLVGTHQAFLLPNPGALQAPGADRLTRALGRRVTTLNVPEQSSGLACAALGTAVPAGRLVQFLAARLIEGEDEGAVEGWRQRLGADLAEDKREALGRMLRQFVEHHVPMLRRLNIVP